MLVTAGLGFECLNPIVGHLFFLSLHMKAVYRSVMLWYSWSYWVSIKIIYPLSCSLHNSNHWSFKIHTIMNLSIIQKMLILQHDLGKCVKISFQKIAFILNMQQLTMIKFCFRMQIVHIWISLDAVEMIFPICFKIQTSKSPKLFLLQLFHCDLFIKDYQLSFQQSNGLKHRKSCHSSMQNA